MKSKEWESEFLLIWTYIKKNIKTLKFICSNEVFDISFILIPDTLYYFKFFKPHSNLLILIQTWRDLDTFYNSMPPFFLGLGILSIFSGIAFIENKPKPHFDMIWKKSILLNKKIYMNKRLP